MRVSICHSAGQAGNIEGLCKDYVMCAGLVADGRNVGWKCWYSIFNFLCLGGDNVCQVCNSINGNACYHLLEYGGTVGSMMGLSIVLVAVLIHTIVRSPYWWGEQY